jgi:hypothetical protein
MLKRRWIFTIFHYRWSQWKKNDFINSILAPVRLRIKSDSHWNWLPIIRVASINPRQPQKEAGNHSWWCVNHNYQDLISHCLELKRVICLNRVTINCFVWATTYKAKVKVWWWNIRLDIINPPEPILLIRTRVLWTITLKTGLWEIDQNPKIIVNFLMVIQPTRIT